VIPADLDSPHAVSFVLTQKRGHLKVKHLQKSQLCVKDLASNIAVHLGGRSVIVDG